MKAILAIALLSFPAYGATEMEIVAAVTQCFADREALLARIAVLEAELKVPDDEPVEEADQ